MFWEKRGRVFVPDPASWMHGYAQVPTPILLPDRIRTYFGCRPRTPAGSLPVSQIAYVDLALDDPTRIIGEAPAPVLSLGRRGCFDEFGLHPLSIVRRGDELWLYYVGWTRMISVPFNRAIGLAISRDGGDSFERAGPGPILGPTLREPYLQQGPSVRMVGDRWHMWYLSGVDWVEHDGRMEAIYQVMHATSEDGVSWTRDGVPCLPTVVEFECQAGQAVVERDGRWHMWFSFRPGLDFRNPERGYRMGYAWSDDAETWHRDDSRAGLSPSETGWDSEMVCYPNVIEHEQELLMFYCGNHFGRDGFGFAKLSAEMPTL